MITTERRRVTADSDAGGAIAVAFGSVWTSAPDDLTVYRIEL